MGREVAVRCVKRSTEIFHVGSQPDRIFINIESWEMIFPLINSILLATLFQRDHIWFRLWLPVSVLVYYKFVIQLRGSGHSPLRKV